jgi:hypothetical protein
VRQPISEEQAFARSGGVGMVVFLAPPRFASLLAPVKYEGQCERVEGFNQVICSAIT